MTMIKDVLRVSSLAAILLAGSCSAPMNGVEDPTGSPSANHPIRVEPQMATIKVNFSAPEAGLLPDDAAQFQRFVSDYLSRGSGSISVSVPPGPDSAAAISYFGTRLFEMGVPRSRILVGTHDGADARVELGFIAYAAKTDDCADWSDNIAVTYDNHPQKNFGCSVQKNIAAQIADPRDIIELRPSDPIDAARRATVLEKYEKGEVTASEKSKDQKGSVSEVNNQ